METQQRRSNRVAMANARVEAELCSCGREQCQTCNWERDWSQEVVRAAYRSLEEHKERARVPTREQSEAAWQAELSSGMFRELTELSQLKGGQNPSMLMSSEQLGKGQRQKQRKYEQRRRKRLELKQRERDQGSEQPTGLWRSTRGGQGCQLGRRVRQRGGLSCLVGCLES